MPSLTSPAVLIASSARNPVGCGDLRVSDAERAQVADQLSRHYTEGRLDQDEFGHRLDQAMTAKTYRDFTGLLRDLPQDEQHPNPPVSAVRPPARRRRRAGLGRLLLAVVAVFFLVASVHAVTWVLAPLLWAAFVCAIVALAAGHRARRR
jgi:hypothetical protein